MSDSPDDSSSAGAPTADDQGSQSRSDRPTDDQPRDAPPRDGYQTGPGVGDIINIPETKTEMKVGVVLSLLLSVGFAMATLGLSTLSTGFGSTLAGVGAAGTAITGPIVVAPIVGIVIGLRQADVLDEQPETLVYANAAVTAFVGVFVLLVVSLVLGLVVVGSGGVGGALGDMLLPYLITSVGAGAVAAGAVWTELNVLPGPVRARSPREQSQPR